MNSRNYWAKVNGARFRHQFTPLWHYVILGWVVVSSFVYFVILLFLWTWSHWYVLGSKVFGMGECLILCLWSDTRVPKKKKFAKARSMRDGTRKLKKRPPKVCYQLFDVVSIQKKKRKRKKNMLFTFILSLLAWLEVIRSWNHYVSVLRDSYLEDRRSLSKNEANEHWIEEWRRWRHLMAHFGTSRVSLFFIFIESLFSLFFFIFFVLFRVE